MYSSSLKPINNYQHMEILGFVYEIIFLAAGIYFFLFSTKRLEPKNNANQQKVDEFIESINPWATIFSVLLILFYAISLIIHLYTSLF
jgi:hypothetical protein